MDKPGEQHVVRDIATLESLYGTPLEAPLKKEIDYIHPHYQRWIEASPFAVLATAGPGGLDASPRGDPKGFVVVADRKTLLLPDRRGNNRIDSLRNIVADPRVALMFLIPGVAECMRVNGRAHITTDPALLARFAIGERQPRSVIVIHVEAAYFQCSRAILRSKLWDPSQHIEPKELPSLGTILRDITAGEFDGARYDAELRGRIASSLY